MTQNYFSKPDQTKEPSFGQVYTTTCLPQLETLISSTMAQDELLLFNAPLAGVSELKSGLDNLSARSLLKMFIGLH